MCTLYWSELSFLYQNKVLEVRPDERILADISSFHVGIVHQLQRNVLVVVSTVLSVAKSHPREILIFGSV